MDPLLPVLLAIAALAVGVALGWLVGRGRAGALAEERAKACDALRVTVAEVGRERDEAVRELAGLQADARKSSSSSAPMPASTRPARRARPS